ncbi:hypothetical protein RJ639_007415 [Escallonia herrerae]|uniref:S-protein homolog n=1 Tax=Escallonia herrerae TaxID=1293975 RepID=A0AA88W1G5_9ASTE|nr:hypothetical protein RJ639_007415 [Escallonia herrerae]
MAPVMKILYLLMIIAFSFACPAWARHSYPTYELHVISRIPQSYPPLTIRCQSKDDDLGYHTLYAGDDFHWRFRNNVIGTTLFFCHFWWDSKQKVFDVFNMKVWADKCKVNNFGSLNTCYWMVNNLGFFFTNRYSESGYWEKIYDWEYFPAFQTKYS